MKYAYVTLATTEYFLKGARFLHHSLQKVKSKYPLIIMVTENLRPVIKDNEYNYHFIPYHKFEYQKGDRYEDTINKLQYFNLLEYEKVFFIDADILIVDNIDDIFEAVSDEFLIGIRPDGYWGKRFCGDRAIVTPKPGVFERVLRDMRTYPDDEICLKDIFPGYFETVQKFDFPYYDKTLHMSGFKKYWEVTDFNLEMLYAMSEDELRNYFLSFGYEF